MEKIDKLPPSYDEAGGENAEAGVVLTFLYSATRRFSNALRIGRRKDSAASHEPGEKKQVYRPNLGDENEDRGNWANQAEFVLSCIGYSVGLGNVWRFPYLCYKNGGGAFLLIYWTLSVSVGFPIVVFEQSIGQYTSQGPLHCWQFAPILRGLGFGMVVVSLLTALYYDIVIAWAVYYLFSSFTNYLPWSSCDFLKWADYRCEMSRVNCSTLHDDQQLRGQDGLCYNLTALGSTEMAVAESNRNTSTVIGYWNETLAREWGVDSVLASAQYFHNYVIGDADPNFGWNNFGKPQWPLVLCLLLVWIAVFLSLINGIKSSGKIVYFTTLAPYVVLLTLCVRGSTLPGATDGILYFLTPDFERIKSPEVWYAAAGQLFFSLSICYGGIITLASYNRFQNNLIRDSIIVVVADTMTSCIAGIAIFSVIGYGAHILQRPIDQVVEAGAGLAFVVYPKVLAQMPGSVFFSIIFFMMLICIGLSTQNNHAQTVYSALLDCFPKLRKTFWTKMLCFAGICLVCFLIGIPFMCPAGPLLVGAFDASVSSWATMLLGLLEILAICWLYGFKRYSFDLKLMMPWIPVRLIEAFSVIFWGILAPGVIAFILIFSWAKYQRHETDTEESVMWILSLLIAIWIPLVAFWTLFTSKGTFKERFLRAFQPSPHYGPYLERFRSQAKHLQLVQVRTSPADIAEAYSKHESGDIRKSKTVAGTLSEKSAGPEYHSPKNFDGIIMDVMTAADDEPSSHINRTYESSEGEQDTTCDFGVKVEFEKETDE